MAGDAWAAAEQQLVAFEGRGAVEVGVAGTGLTEQVLGNEAAQIHRLLTRMMRVGTIASIVVSAGPPSRQAG